MNKLKNINLFIINLIFGFLILLSYIILIPLILKKGIKMNRLWGGITGNYRIMYYISILITAISYIYIIYRYSKIEIINNKLIYTGTIIFLVSSIAWTLSLYGYFVKKMSVMLISMCLNFVVVGTSLILIQSFLYNKELILKICSVILLFQTLIMDGIIYSISFYKNEMN